MLTIIPPMMFECLGPLHYITLHMISWQTVLLLEDTGEPGKKNSIFYKSLTNYMYITSEIKQMIFYTQEENSNHYTNKAVYTEKNYVEAC